MQAKPKPTRSLLKLLNSKLEAEDFPPFSFWTLPISGASPSLNFSPLPSKVCFFSLFSPSFSFEHVHDGRLRLEPLLLALLFAPDIVEKLLTWRVPKAPNSTNTEVLVKKSAFGVRIKFVN